MDEQESASTSEDEVSREAALGLFDELDEDDRELMDQVDRIKNDKRYKLFGPYLKLQDLGLKRPSNGSAYPL